MKKKNLQKLFAATLAGAMAMGALAGCGNNSDSGSSPAGGSASGSTPETSSSTPGGSQESGGNSSETDSNSGNAVAGMEGWTAFDSNVTLSIPVYDRGQEGIPAIGENYWEKWIQENFADQYNITLNFVPIPRNKVNETYALLAASHELPTFMMEYDYDKLALWVAEGYLQEYDIDEFAFVAPEYYGRMVELDQIKYTTMNDGRYFVVAERPYYNTGENYVTWFRMDWLRQVGYDHLPANYEEELDAMQKIMEAGIAEHPGGGHMSLSGRGLDQNYAYRDFPTDEEEWVMYGDYAIPSLGWEPNKRLLKIENQKYNLGITDPEYYVTDEATEKANFINGKLYKYGDYIASNIDWLASFYAANPDAELVVGIQSLEPDTTIDTVPAFRSSLPFGMGIGFTHEAGEDEVKAAMMYMEWMAQEDNLFTLQWGYEGEHFEYGEDGLPVAIEYTGSEHTQGYLTNKDYWCVAIETKNAGTMEDMIRTSTPTVGIPEGVDFTDDLIQNYYNKEIAWEKGWVVTDCMFATTINAASEYENTLLSLYLEYRDRLITCDPDEFDALYDELAKAYADAGYAEIAEERLQAYKDGLTSRME